MYNFSKKKKKFKTPPMEDNSPDLTYQDRAVVTERRQSG